jgi:hypothetical protein
MAMRERERERRERDSDGKSSAPPMLLSKRVKRSITL